MHREAALSISKLVNQLAFVDRSYSLGLWSSDEAKAMWRHDLQLMHSFGDLKGVTLQLYDAHHVILLEFEVTFDGRQVDAAIDKALGVELPVLNHRDVAGHRVIIDRNGRSKEYKERLRCAWSAAPKLSSRATDGFDSEHARRITGGRQCGRFRVIPAARHRLQITCAGARGFAFAKGVDLNLDGVYLDQRFAPPGYRFTAGEQITALVVQTPRGLQARNIQPLGPTAEEAETELEWEVV